ncbi:hypothetical protein [Arenibaculum pallidiluteum]|uniref:hypothetical protein n=1 Tax=Arenibaculum pallidiluteum TaxID=2812559 RepID=UPI001A97217B|nr:hypothetical protein [Arenibaculum pallidiluteum]
MADETRGSRLESEQVRAATDRGALRDKIPVEDPATAPLGTDAESSGVRPQVAASRAGLKDPGPESSRWRAGFRAGPVPDTATSMGAMLVGVALAVVLVLVVAVVAGVF